MLVALLVSLEARAEDDTRVAAAKTACVAGDVDRGVHLLAELFTATNDPIWIFNQGRCYQQNGQVQPAILRFREYLRKTPDATDPEVKTTRDEATGYLRELELELPRPARPLDGSSTLRRTGIASAAVGAALVVGGSVFGILTRAAADRKAELTRGSGLIEAERTRALASVVREGQRDEVLQWVGYGVGATALTAGVVLYLLGRPDAGEGGRVAVAPFAGPGGAGALVRVRM